MGFPSSGAPGDFFGSSVSISGDTAVVGASGDDVGAGMDQGSAHVFVRSGGVWTQQQQLTGSDGLFGDRFGESVSISGDTLVVGAFGADVGPNSNQGAAYVFVRSGSVWTQQGKLVAADGIADDNFGASVSISGDTVVAGTYCPASQGSAYVFVRSPGVWAQQQKLVSSDGAPGDRFGVSVSVSGDTVVAGAPNHDVGTNGYQGTAYVS